MSGLSTMCHPGTTDAETTDTYIFDPAELSAKQSMGGACAVCHVRWPRPRVPMGALPDGSRVYGCAECASAITAHTAQAPHRKAPSSS